MGLRGSRDLTSAIAVRRGAGDGGWFPAVRGGEREVVALWWLPVSGPRWLLRASRREEDGAQVQPKMSRAGLHAQSFSPCGPEACPQTGCTKLG
jgi:hypothetical protein